MKIQKGRRVRIRVRLQVVDGDEIEKRVVEYFQGAGTMLPGLEAVLDGLEKGDSRKGVLPAERAFGDPSLQVEKKLARSEFPADAELAIGAQFAANLQGVGQEVTLRVKEVSDEEVTVMLVPALADKAIEYDVEVLAVTEPAKPPPLPADAIGTAEAD